MAELRRDEKLAAATITATLGLEVEQNDDGRRPGMHDLNIVLPEGSFAAVEVTAAADGKSIELWKLVNRGFDRWIVPSLQGGWLLDLEPTARAKRILKELPALLLEMEQHGITYVLRGDGQEAVGSIQERARQLGIVQGDQSPTDFPGSIYLVIDRPSEQTGGTIDESGSAVSDWISAFLLDPRQHDVLTKLSRSGADERHAFILIPAFSTAPFGVVDMLWRGLDEVVPRKPPLLPEQVTHVWLMTFWDVGSGLRWSPDQGWQRFARSFDTRDRSPGVHTDSQS